VAGVPLNVLLSHALTDLTRATKRVDPSIDLVMWSNVLRVVDGLPAKTAHLDARISRRAMKSMLTVCTRTGLCVDDGGTIVLTDTGRAMASMWSAAIADAEAAWPHRDSVRAALTPVVAAFDLEYAHYPIWYGTADVSVTGGPGVDWKRVARARDTDTTSDLSVLALLSQTWMAFAIEYEWKRRGSLHWALHLASSFHGEGGSVPLGDAPPALQITGTGKSATERHGIVRVKAGVARLTPVGEVIRSSYASLAAEIEESWRSRYGSDIRPTLEAVDATLPGGLPDHPEVHWVNGAGFRELSAASS